MVSQPIPMFDYAFLHWDLIPIGFSYHSIPWNLIPSYPKVSNSIPPYTTLIHSSFLKIPLFLQSEIPVLQSSSRASFNLLQSGFSFPVLTGDLLFFFPCSHRWLLFFGSSVPRTLFFLHSILSASSPVSSIPSSPPASRQLLPQTGKRRRLLQRSKYIPFFFLSFPRNFNFNC